MTTIPARQVACVPPTPVLEDHECPECRVFVRTWRRPFTRDLVLAPHSRQHLVMPTSHSREFRTCLLVCKGSGHVVARGDAA